MTSVDPVRMVTICSRAMVSILWTRTVHDSRSQKGVIILADVFFKRGTAAEISAVPVTDGYILWDTTNNIIYMDNGTKRHLFAVGGEDGIRPIKYGGTGASDSGTIATSLKLDTLDASSTCIPEGGNLDNYNQAGVYMCENAGIAASLSNCPFSTGSFVLVVRYVESTSSYVQWLIGLCESASYIWHVRNCINGVYCQWRGLSDTMHTHGKLTADGKIGTTANLAVFTGSGGAVEAVSASSARFKLGMTLDNLTNIHICDSAPTSVTNGHWYLVKGG